MKTTATVLLASLATAAAFTGSSSTAPRTRSTVAVNSAQADLESLAADLNPSIKYYDCLLYTSPSPRDGILSRMPSSA